MRPATPAPPTFTLQGSIFEKAFDSMVTLLIAFAAFAGYIIAYYTYGRWISRKIFKLDHQALVPSKELQDDVDYVPTNAKIVFGHHFTSIAGTGPIVGPAIAVFWGWLPALLWVVFGSIFIGAVHDFGSLVVSLRNRGQTVGEVAGRLINPRARLLFLLVLFLALTIVIAIFGLVIANIFQIYPSSVLASWIVIPLAVVIGLFVHRKGASVLLPSIIALCIIYGCVWLGANFEFAQIKAPTIEAFGGYGSPILVWTVLLLIYCFFASVLPVWLMLQPRDFINSQQLFLAMGLLLVGLVVAGANGSADLLGSAPAINQNIPKGAPPILPFLFITIACGACSGFHCLVSSGTSSKQVACETDARSIGYGSMLLEGALATIVILCCTAGLGMGAAGSEATGLSAWHAYYVPGSSWGEFGLGKKIGAFVDGGANFLSATGLPFALGTAIIAVLVATFAATTLDTATRLQRYVIQELAGTLHIAPLKDKYVATTFAVVTGGAMAILPGPTGVPGTGGLILWPLFGATNQLLAGLAFTVIVFYLIRRNLPYWFALIPMIIMLIIPGWAMLDMTLNDFQDPNRFPQWQRRLLTTFGITITALQLWMMLEALLMWKKAKGVLEEALPPLSVSPSTAGSN